MTLSVEYYPGQLTLTNTTTDYGTVSIDGIVRNTESFTAPAEWKGVETTLSAANMPADFADFSSLSDDEAKAIPAPDSEGDVTPRAWRPTSRATSTSSPTPI